MFTSEAGRAVRVRFLSVAEAGGGSVSCGHAILTPGAPAAAVAPPPAVRERGQPVTSYSRKATSGLNLGLPFVGGQLNQQSVQKVLD